MGRNRPLSRGFYDRDTLTVAADLIGKVLVRPTKRNAPLYGPPGVAYVYLNYGMHYLVNAVTESEGSPAAVLIRALEPLEGLEVMSKRRGGGGGEAAGRWPAR